MNMCALLKKDREIRRISLNQDLQSYLPEYLAPEIEFYENAKEQEFTGEYRPEEDENTVLRISNFEFPYEIDVSNFLSIEILRENQIGEIKAIFFINEDMIACQAFDNRKIIKPERMFLLYSGNTFSKIDSRGLIIDSKIDALFSIKEKKILFKSFYSANKIFDLSNYYREATDSEVEKFYKNKIFINTKSLKPEIFSPRLRKKIFLIERNNVLGLVKKNFSVVCDYAKELNVGNYFDKSKGKIAFPDDKKEIEKLINFLNEDLFKSPISNSVYETNSKRKIS